MSLTPSGATSYFLSIHYRAKVPGKPETSGFDYRVVESEGGFADVNDFRDLTMTLEKDLKAKLEAIQVEVSVINIVRLPI